MTPPANLWGPVGLRHGTPVAWCWPAKVSSAPRLLWEHTSVCEDSSSRWRTAPRRRAHLSKLEWV